MSIGKDRSRDRGDNIQEENVEDRSADEGFSIGGFPAIPDDAFNDLENLYKSVDEALSQESFSCKMDGACCCFEESGLNLFATYLEAAYLIKKSGELKEKISKKICPFLNESLCKARSGRTLGCRLYYCGDNCEESFSLLYENFHDKIKKIHHFHGIEYIYKELLSFPFFK